MKAVCWMMNEPKQHVDPKPKGPVAGSRSAGAVLAILSGAVLLTAALLTPRAGGLGTHVQMGLSSCGYLADTGYPCPTCGMTTAMAATASGHLGLAIYAQPFGPVLFLALMGTTLAGTWQAATGRRVLGQRRVRWWWLLIPVALLLAGWGIKIALGVVQGEYPIQPGL